VRERAINLELRILGNVLKEANLWRTIGQHYKPIREPESEVGQALTVGQFEMLEKIAATKDAWVVAYCAEVLAANTGLRGGEIRGLQLGTVDFENRRIGIHRKATKTNAGQRLIELNHAAAAAVAKLYTRAQSLGATEPTRYLLPADLSRHTAKSDPLKGKRGFDVNLSQTSRRTAWRNLREAAANAVRDAATLENRELTTEERKTGALFKGLHFHSLRHSLITLIG
jgi:integrase